MSVTSKDLTAKLNLLNGRDAKIVIVGMGYVGFPLAVAFAREGFSVTGIDIDAVRVNRINAGVPPYDSAEYDLLIEFGTHKDRISASTFYAAVGTADVVLVAVQTPLMGEGDSRSDLSFLKNAARQIGAHMTGPTLVVLNSTVVPGTTFGPFKEALEAAYLAWNSGPVCAGRDYWLGYTPERVTPGAALRDLQSVPRVVGADDEDTRLLMGTLYSFLMDMHLITGATVREAETVKVAENALRDVEIAFANEVAVVCKELGVDVTVVRRLMNYRDDRNMLEPGAGVGGHCLTKDGLLLAQSAPHVDMPMINAARYVNDGMPGYIYSLLRDMLDKHILDDPTVVVLGVAYKPDTDDDRNSPTLALLDILRGDGLHYRVHDPLVSPYDAALIKQIFNDADAVVLMTAHTLYRKIHWPDVAAVMRTKIFVDGRNMIPFPSNLVDGGWEYTGVGR